MPRPETLRAFIDMVESNRHDQAIERFYAPNSSMQENQSEPRVGRDGNVARETAILAKAKSVYSKCIEPALLSGDYVAIRWLFRLTWLDNSYTEMEEMAWQRWDGELIAEEKFFYDPDQRTPREPATAGI